MKGVSKIGFFTVGVLFVLLLVAEVVVQIKIEQKKSDSEIIEDAARQRMLGMKMENLALHITYDRSKTSYVRDIFLLSVTNELWAQNHNELKIRYQSAFQSQQTDSLFEHVHTPFVEIHHAGIRISELVDHSGEIDSLVEMVRFLDQIALSVPVYSDAINALVQEFKSITRQKNRNLSYIQYSFLLLTIVLIFAAGYMIIQIGTSVDKDLNNDNLLRLVNNTDDFAILTLDKKGNIQTWNSGAERITGYLRKEITGRNMSIFHTSEDKKIDKPKMLLETALAEEVAKDQGWRVRKNGSRFWASVTISTIRNRKGKLVGFGKVTRDLTDKLRADRAEALEEKNKEMEQFTYIASHDLKQPLNTITHYTLLVKEDKAVRDSEDINVYLDTINRASDRMLGLIHAILDYSRLGQSSSLQVLDCDQLLDEVRENLAAQIKTNSAKIISTPLPNVIGLEVEMRQLLQNLLSNAIKFRKPDTAPVIYVSGVRSKDYWIFTVSDNGIGIGLKDQDKIFNIFHRLNDKRDYDGQGIGLAYCKKIVELHRGKIWVESSSSNGTVFKFSVSMDLLS